MSPLARLSNTPQPPPGVGSSGTTSSTLKVLFAPAGRAYTACALSPFDKFPGGREPMFTQPRRLATMAAVLCAGAVVASAGAASSALAASVDPAAAALVPAKIKSAGTVTVAADATYAPDESIASDGHTVVGMDPDLAVALSNKLGLKTKVVNATSTRSSRASRRASTTSASRRSPTPRHVRRSSTSSPTSPPASRSSSRPAAASP